MLNTMTENENTSFCSEHGLRKGIEILAKLVFSFSIKVFNMMKLLVILFKMKLIAQMSVFK